MQTIFIIGISLFGYLFLTSALGKIKRFKNHEKIIRAYQIVPYKSTKFFAVLDVSFEVIVGLFLVTSIFLEISIPFASFMLLVYSIAVSINLLRGRKELDCGCGGIVGDNKISIFLVIRNITFIMILILLGNSMKFEGIQEYNQMYWIVQLLIVQFIILIYAYRHLKQLKGHYEKIGGSHG